MSEDWDVFVMGLSAFAYINCERKIVRSNVPFVKWYPGKSLMNHDIRVVDHASATLQPSTERKTDSRR